MCLDRFQHFLTGATRPFVALSEQGEPWVAKTHGNPLGTKTILGALGLGEVTHTAPKQGDFLNVIEFSFQWTPPASFTSTTMRAWGMAVNHDGTASRALIASPSQP